jgi:hypothetical protein
MTSLSHKTKLATISSTPTSDGGAIMGLLLPFDLGGDPGHFPLVVMLREHNGGGDDLLGAALLI